MQGRLHAIFLALLYCIFSVNAAQICNNAAALCSRTYDNVTYLGAHDSPFVRNKTNVYSGAGDQIYTPIQQLDSGVRLLSAQVHAVTGADGQTQWRLCHTLCQLYDAGYLVDWLKSIKTWLDSNPNEIVTLLLVNSDCANTTVLSSIYQSAGVVPISYHTSQLTPSTSFKWPTLSSMISSNTRLVTFVASLSSTSQSLAASSAPYLLDEFTWLFENPYEVIYPSLFSCDPDRPSSLKGNINAALSSGHLPLMNHFRYDNISGIEIPSVDHVNVTNSADTADVASGSLGTAAGNCSAYYGRAPTFVLTDFSNVGRAVDTVDRLNRVLGRTSGRLALPDSYEGSVADPSPSSIAVVSTMMTGARSGSGSVTATGTAVVSAAGASGSTSGAGRVGGDGLFGCVWVGVVSWFVGAVLNLSLAYVF